MTPTAKDLLLGYLQSRNIGEALEELRALDLSLPIEGFIERYNLHNRQGQPKVIKSLSVTKEILNLLVPVLGTPISYSVELRRGWNYNSSKQITEKAKHVTWKVEDIQQMLTCCNLLYDRYEYYTTKREIKIFVPEGCFVQVLMKTDDPEYWKQECNRKYKQLTERRKIGQVTKKLDRDAD